ncbi:hypothetical protein [Microlunatus parietis]|uniref:Uncharacterized protein n=1 Tax=Microlunatus parietis TaxID=682979 RepID=A0A7Y9IBR8_9ACTN|nr:hypothetical protein [Microlunatus parietis]NYE73902.1 hypothetical protein [Microlunatus parietis]
MNDQRRTPSSGQPSEGPSGYSTAETSYGGADAVPDTPDALPNDDNEPPRLRQPEYPDDPDQA